jgi:hypothetical protein
MVVTLARERMPEPRATLDMFASVVHLSAICASWGGGEHRTYKGKRKVQTCGVEGRDKPTMEGTHGKMVGRQLGASSPV